MLALRRLSPLLLLAAALVALAVLFVGDGARSAQAQQQTPSVFFITATDVMSEVGGHGLRNSELITVRIDPPLGSGGSNVYVRIRSSSDATLGEDYSIFMPEAPGGDPMKRVLRLPAGESSVKFGITFKKDMKTDAFEIVHFDLEAIENAPYVVADDHTMSRYNNLEISIFDDSQPIPSDADPNRGITFNPRKMTVGASATVSYTVVLDSRPSDDVAVIAYFDTPGGAVDLSHAGRALRVSPAVLTFTSTNWNVPQTFTVTPQEGFEPWRHYIIHGLVSDDPDYSSSHSFQGRHATDTHVRVAVGLGGL